MKRFLKALSPVWKPHPGQLEFLLSPAKYRVLACGRRWGKTDACAALTLHGVCGEEPTKHLLLAPTLDQARILFDRVLDLFHRLVGKWPFAHAPPEGKERRRTPYPSIRLGPHVISARSGHIGKSLRGNEATHVIIDEAAFVPEELVTEVAMPMLATTKGSLTMISTPRGLNHFWRFFKMGQDAQNGFWSRTAPSAESPLVSKEFLAVQREMISERAYATEYEAQFQDSESRVFKTEAIDGALRTEVLFDANEDVCIGVDWGKYTDYTAVAVVAGNRREARLVACERFNKMSWAEMVHRVAEIARKFSSGLVLSDATGVGDPVFDDLNVALPHHTLVKVKFDNTTKHAHIDNLTWMFENRAIAMAPHPELMRELQHFDSSTTAMGRTRFGAQSGYHDDLVIALALACMKLPSPYRAEVQVGPSRTFSHKLA